MPYVPPVDWVDAADPFSSSATPLSAANIEAMEAALAAHTDDQLAAALAVPRLVLAAGSMPSADYTASNRWLTGDGGPLTSAQAGAGGTAERWPLWELVGADLAIPDYTAKIRLWAQVLTNTTAPGINFTFTMRPATAAGGSADNVAVTAGAAVGSSVVFTTPGTSAIVNDAVSFDLPADGVYGIMAESSGTLTNNAMVQLSGRLELFYVPS